MKFVESLLQERRSRLTPTITLCFIGTVYSGSGSAMLLVAQSLPAAAGTSVGSSTTTIVAQHSGSCLDVPDGAATPGLRIQQWSCVHSMPNNQTFTLAATSDGEYLIHSPAGAGLCLDAGSGGQIVQNACSGVKTQEWNLGADTDGTYTITTIDGVNCLDIAGVSTADGAQVLWYPCNHQKNEKFTLAGFSGTAVVTGPQRNITAPNGAITVKPGSDLQASINQNPAGTTFYLTAGVYRTQQLTPLSGDTFLGAYGADLNGSVPLTNFSASGTYYVANQAPSPSYEIQGVCITSAPRCDHPQEIYFNGKPLAAVSTLAALTTTGQFYFDYSKNDIYLLANPAGNTVEISYSPYAFGGTATNVTIQNLLVEKYASADQQGAIGNHGEGSGWTISHNEVMLNYGYGIVQGNGSQTLNNTIHHNGEIGVGGGGITGAVTRGNEIAFNLWNGTSCDWECGGAKWGAVTNLSVIGNTVHDNQGPGLWTDESSSAITYDSNVIQNNLLAGISHEISSKCLITNNTFQGNGKTTATWGWNAQIQIQNSTDTEVSGNKITLDPTLGGNGIMIIQQDRGAQHMPKNDSVHNNTITIPGANGVAAGWFADYDPASFTTASGLFDYNSYIVDNAVSLNGAWAPNDWGTFAAWQATGQDLHGTVSQ